MKGESKVSISLLASIALLGASCGLLPDRGDEAANTGQVDAALAVPTTVTPTDISTTVTTEPEVLMITVDGEARSEVQLADGDTTGDSATDPIDDDPSASTTTTRETTTAPPSTPTSTTAKPATTQPTDTSGETSPTTSEPTTTTTTAPSSTTDPPDDVSERVVFPDLSVKRLTDGGDTTLSAQLVGGTPVLLWYWQPG